MKIVYVENVRIPSERAHAYQIVQACAWFARLGHEVTLVNPDRAGDADVFPYFGIDPGLFQHVRLPVSDPLSWKWFPSKKIAYVWQRFSFTRALKRWAATQHADVWYTRDPAMVDVLRATSRRIALELHDRPDSQPSRWDRIKSSVSEFVVITKSLSEKLVSLGVSLEKICVAPDGYDPLEFKVQSDRARMRERLKLPASAFVAMYTGSFYPWKGVDLVVRAWNKTSPDAHLVLIGGPEGDRRRIESLVPQEVASRIHVFPAVERTEALRLLAAADVGLLTSSAEHEIARLYTSPLKQFEYLASGLPILASDVPSSHEILTEHVARFYAQTEEGVASAVESIRTDTTGWLGKARIEALHTVAPYTWEARAKAILAHLVRA